jgi:hypothetical protein
MMRSSHRRQAGWQVGGLQEGHKWFVGIRWIVHVLVFPIVFTLSLPILQVETRGKGRGRAATSVDQMELVVNLDAAGADALRWGYFTNYWGLDGLRMIWRLGELV